MSTGKGNPLLTRAVELYGSGSFRAGWAERLIDPWYALELLAYQMIEGVPCGRGYRLWEVEKPPAAASVKEDLSPEEYRRFAASREAAKALCEKHGLGCLFGADDDEHGGDGSITAQHGFVRSASAVEIWWAFTITTPKDGVAPVVHMRWIGGYGT